MTRTRFQECTNEELLSIIAELTEKLKQKKADIKKIKAKLATSKYKIQKLKASVAFQRKRILQLYKDGELKINEPDQEAITLPN